MLEQRGRDLIGLKIAALQSREAGLAQLLLLSAAVIETSAEPSGDLIQHSFGNGQIASQKVR